jgi:hypothetical protein
MASFPDVDELIWLFEEEPVPDPPDEVIPGVGSTDWRRDWPYTSLTFRTVRDDDEVEFGINPGYEWISIALTRSGRELFRVEAGQVQSVVVPERLHGREELHVFFRPPGVEKLRLVLKPAVALSWQVHRFPF